MIPETCGRKIAAWASYVALSMTNRKYKNAATPLTAATSPTPSTHCAAAGWGPFYTNRNWTYNNKANWNFNWRKSHIIFKHWGYYSKCCLQQQCKRTWHFAVNISPLHAICNLFIWGHTAYRALSILVMKNRLMMYKVKAAVCCEIHTKHTNGMSTPCITSEH